jgi:hypothetical protein
MKQMLMAKVEDAVAETLKTFFTQVEREYNIPKDVLWKKWKEEDKVVATALVVPKKETLNKKSDYQTFFSIQRNKMVKENPQITFGEISKQVSHMWKKLSREEKVQYTANNTTPITEKTSLEDLRKEYMKISTADLKNLCKEKGIVAKFRKKEEIVGALVGWEEKKLGLAFPPEEMISKGRSKLELSAEDKDEEEEDFYFHDDGSSTSNESRACDEDDAGILISDDDDIFGDDD